LLRNLENSAKKTSSDLAALVSTGTFLKNGDAVKMWHCSLAAKWESLMDPGQHKVAAGKRIRMA